MTDDELFGQTASSMAASAPDASPAPSAPASAPALPQDTDARLIARAAVAEGDQNNPQSYQNVAGVVYNRMQKTGKTAAEILSEPGQFEAYGNGHIQKVDTSSPQFQTALAATQPVLAGKVTVPYDSFYQPDIVAQRGVKPPFDPKTGTMIGTQLFGSGYQGSAATLTPDEEAQWAKLYGPQVPGLVDPKEPGQPSHGLAPPAQANASEFLSLHGLSDPNAAPGSETNPVADGVAGRPTPTTPGTWHITTDGRLQQVGSDIPDYLPGYRQTVSQRDAAAAAPAPNRLLTSLGQGVTDVAASVNKLTGGSFAVGDPTYAALGSTLGGPTIPQIAQSSIEGNRQEIQSYNLLHGGDALMAGGRFAGQLGATVPLLATGTEALEGLGPIGEFAAGATRGNPLLTGASRAAGGALQGAGASALTSGTSDRPLGEQIGTGALAGGVLGPVAPVLTRGATNLLTGASDAVSPAVRDLADLAVSKYKIPLRGSQIAGVADRATAIRDSNLIAEPGTGFAANNAAQKQAFTKAVAGTFGEDADQLAPEVLQRARTRIGGVMNDVAQRTTITDTDPLLRQLGSIVHDAQQVLPDPEVSPLLKQVENIGSTIQNGQLSGDSYQALTRTGSALDRAQNSGNSNIRYYAGQIRDALDDALENHADPQDLSDLQNARFQYKNLMTIKNLAAKANVEGTISPTLLSGAVNQSFKNRAFSGAGDLGELSQIGQTFMKEPPQSGTAPRLADMLKRNVLPIGLEGGAGLALMHDPALALKLGAAGLAAAGLKYTGNVAAGLRNGPLGANLLLRGGQPVAGPVGNLLNSGGALVNKTYVPAGVLLGRSQPNLLLGAPAGP